MSPKKVFDGVFEQGRTLLTKNFVPGNRVYGEKIFAINGAEYREWVPFRSKLGAGIRKGMGFFPFKKGSRVLYLGCAEGTTPSHVSDIIGETGFLVGVDISARSMQKFMRLCGERKNMVPVLADAGKPEEYPVGLKEIRFDVIFEDVAHPMQAEILNRNAEVFLKKGGYALLTVKARSIDSAKNPRIVIEAEAKKIEEKLEILEIISLHPFEKDHALIVCKKK
jgi:fibrillarin-like pre-rRNA processing protein